MIIIDTPYHITFDYRTTNPVIACTGKCRKVWWLSDFERRDSTICPQCGSSGLCEAVEKVHFSVLNRADRALRLGDFTSATKVNSKDKAAIKGLLEKGVVIEGLGVVKPAFIEKAKKEWC